MIAILIFTTQIGASDFPRLGAVLGSIAGNGTIELRGVSITGESTVFSGDAVRTGNRSYAKLALADGNKVELFADTRASFSRGPEEVRAVLTAGNLGFAVSAKPVVINVGGFEIVPSGSATGGVAFLNDDYAGIRVRTGSVVVRNTRTKEMFKVAASGVQIIDVKTEQTNVPIAHLASSSQPATLPAPGRTLPPQQPPTTHPTPKEWAAIIGGIGAGTGVALYFCCIRDSSPSKP
jgi:ferric-dicitrate binding protein FerR (iron transport regulator)